MPHPEPPRSDLPAQPQLLRFGLKQMFWAVTLICILITTMVLTKGPWPMIIGGGVLLILAHVLGNLIGTRLRDTSADVTRWRASHPRLGPDHPQVHQEPVDVTQLDLPSHAPLADRGRVVGNWIYWVVAGGGIAGALLGGAGLLVTIGPRIGWAGWLVATISCAVLGTWLAFLASSFGTITSDAWRHAKDVDKPELEKN